MKTAKKTAIIVSVISIIMGLIISFCALIKIDFDFSRLSTVEYETKVYQVEQSFKNIEVYSNECNIRFALLENNDCKVEVRAQSDETSNNAISVGDDTLTVKHSDGRKWYESIGVNFETPEITVYLPKNNYESLYAQSLSGNIEITKKISFNNIVAQSNSGSIKISSADIRKDLSVKTMSGDIVLSGLNAENIYADGDSGIIKISKTVALEKINSESLSGDIYLNKCDAKTLLLKSDSGNVIGTLLSGKVFDVHSDSGNVNVPQSDLNCAEKCEIRALSGDVRIAIEAE